MTRRIRRTFGCVRKLPSGKYQASYLKPSGTRQTAPETFQTRFEADKWLAGIRTDIYRGDWKNPEQGLLKLKQFIHEYMSQKKSQLAPKTFEGYENLIKKAL
jgi:hypothetical protein